MNLESFDSLVISLLDVSANMALFKKELSMKLDIPLVCIGDPQLKNEVVNGMVKQYIYVRLCDKVELGKLLNLGFDYFHDGCIVFEVGDVML